MQKMIEVPATEANNYSRILTLLGMEEEGDPVEEVDRLRNDTRRVLLGRCLSVISTIEGEDTTEQEMLDDLQRDIKQAMGVTPLVPGTLI